MRGAGGFCTVAACKVQLTGIGALRSVHKNVSLQCFRPWISQERRRLGDDVIHLDPFTVILRAAVLALADLQLAFAHSHTRFHTLLSSL